MNNKEKNLKRYITNFVVEIGVMATVPDYNKAWKKMMKKIDGLKLFGKEPGS